MAPRRHRTYLHMGGSHWKCSRRTTPRCETVWIACLKVEGMPFASSSVLTHDCTRYPRASGKLLAVTTSMPGICSGSTSIATSAAAMLRGRTARSQSPRARMRSPYSRGAGLQGSSTGGRVGAGAKAVLGDRAVSRGTATVELSVVVPCYNEEGNLPELVERTERIFERRRIRGELVLVNDGSRDGTAAQIAALAARHPSVVGVHHPTNLGIPAAWRSGFERSCGRYVCTIDADLQYQPEAIALLHREMCCGNADLVQGWRSTLERRHDHRYYLSRGLDYLLKLAFAMPGCDVKSGFVLYRREVFDDILQESGRFYYFQQMITVVV